MCITFIFINDSKCLNSKYKLILVNNRDEIYNRATKDASIMQIEEGINSIYGVDMGAAIKGGTWLGVSKSNKNNENRVKIGNLANVTEEVDVSMKMRLKGRGCIVTDWINNKDSLSSHNEKLFNKCEEFNSFNFLSIDIQEKDIEASYISNSPKNLSNLTPGIFGLGNSPLKSPFKKVEAGVEIFKKIISENYDEQEELIESLKTFLRCDFQHFPDDELIKRKHENPERFSSIHIELKDLGYGTRTHTILLVSNDNEVDYIEETMVTTDPHGPWKMTRLRLP